MNRDALSPEAIGPFELEDIAELPGTYFNARSEITIVIDDSGSVDQSVLPETGTGADWIRISEEPALDDQFRDQLFERYEDASRDGPSAGDLDSDSEADLGEDGSEDRGAGFDPGP